MDQGFPNFSIEMETGTGKTYVYIRTALELAREFGLSKFLVIVPSVAVREGVLQTLTATHDHLAGLYPDVAYRWEAYSSDNLTQVRNFALSDGVEFLVMTLDSFNKASNVMLQASDRLQGEMPVDLISQTRPILILDEPQNMESELSIRSLGRLAPLCALRYSATHRNPYNPIYRLTPFDAYRLGLVKRIEVAAAQRASADQLPYLRLDAIRAGPRSMQAKLTVRKRYKSGAIKDASVTVRPGDSLEQKTQRGEYAGYDVDEIDALRSLVRFSSGAEIALNDSVGGDIEPLFREQIRYTIEEHFRKQERLRPAGLKVLSLFFIDRVDNYARPDGLIRRLFVEEFSKLRDEYPEWRDTDPDSVQAAYFAQRRQQGDMRFIDSRNGETREDQAVYNLIMRRKERLLSFDEPVAFIFSHSALREGWDNPNIFQICTLSSARSEMRKRQEIGRGVRLAVDQSGARVHDEQANVLTVIANESYEKYVAQLQKEIEDEYGPDGLPPPPGNAHQRRNATRRNEAFHSVDFQLLWAQIKHKTRYHVVIDSERLIQDAADDLKAATIAPPRIVVQKAAVRVGSEDRFEAVAMSAARPVTIEESGRAPDVVGAIIDILGRDNPPLRLTRRTVAGIIRNAGRLQDVRRSPQEFATVTARILKRQLRQRLLDGIVYERIGETYGDEQWSESEPSWEQYLVAASRSLYDRVPVDSATERRFVIEADARTDVRLFAKLPRWFTVPTPLGLYNPDWAIVMDGSDGGSRLFLVRETKSATDPLELRGKESLKTVAGEAHFAQALQVDYRVITSAKDLP